MKTENRFEVGRRVRKRGTSKKGYIMHLDSCHARVKWDDPLFQGGESSTALDLLKLLKPKLQAEVKEPQEYWLVDNGNELVATKYIPSCHDGIHKYPVHVRECIQNEASITRERLEEVYRKHLIQAGCVHIPDLAFEVLAKHLGFEDSK